MPDQNPTPTTGAQVAPIERVFTFGGTQLPDPNPALTVSEVQQVLAASHPEIATAKIEGPEVDGAIQRFNIVRAVGTKG